MLVAALEIVGDACLRLPPPIQLPGLRAGRRFERVSKAMPVLHPKAVTARPRINHPKKKRLQRPRARNRAARFYGVKPHELAPGEPAYILRGGDSLSPVILRLIVRIEASLLRDSAELNDMVNCAQHMEAWLSRKTPRARIVEGLLSDIALYFPNDEDSRAA